MILADTSIWIDHLRKVDRDLAARLDRQSVLTHPFIIGKLALGSLKHRKAFLGALQNMPIAVVARDDEVRQFIEDNALFGTGIGYVDAHLLAATRLTPGASFWTRDRRLRDIAVQLSLAA